MVLKTLSRAFSYRTLPRTLPSLHPSDSYPIVDVSFFPGSTMASQTQLSMFPSHSHKCYWLRTSSSRVYPHLRFQLEHYIDRPSMHTRYCSLFRPYIIHLSEIKGNAHTTKLQSTVLPNTWPVANSINYSE